ncbi:MAG: fused MFS/spermidine synthase [Planctomycetes bacterium]|nr:fused MFS/spermidine synthase [Planctomycetota bacterium]
MRLPALYLTSIICGFCMMALEILGGRFIQPIFGSSIDVWAAIISVFILSLSIGYVIGGRIADRARTNQPLGWLIIGAGIFYCLMPWYGTPFMEALGESVHTARWGVLLAALVLYLPPSLLLGTVSPILVKLVFTGADKVGSTTGMLYAVGSIGNVLGILVADYVLLKYVGLNANIFSMGVILGVLGVAHLLITIAATSPAAAAASQAPAAAVAVPGTTV